MLVQTVSYSCSDSETALLGMLRFHKS